LSEAVAATGIVPETVAPETGEVTETVGGVVSEPLAVVKVKSPLVARFPEAFLDFTR
jgi:hypothetical protein